jgi:hypothetical protein
LSLIEIGFRLALFRVKSLAEEMIEANAAEGAADWAPVLVRRDVG